MVNVQSAAAEGNTRMERQYISSYYTIVIFIRLLASGDNGDTIASIGLLISLFIIISRINELVRVLLHSFKFG